MILRLVAKMVGGDKHGQDARRLRGLSESVPPLQSGDVSAGRHQFFLGRICERSRVATGFLPRPIVSHGEFVCVLAILVRRKFPVW
jgi:hypothetical protein